MADKSPIEWTDATWNPIVGCSIATTGCTHCYAMRMAARIEAMGGPKHYAGTTKKVNGNAVWTGKLALAPDRILTEPLRWTRPRRIFVNSMGDLFHEDVPDEWIDRVFAVMALAPQHTFQVLTKRAGRMQLYLSDVRTPRRVYDLVCDMVTIDGYSAVLLASGIPDPGLMPAWPRVPLGQWPITNVWLGVSAERQQEANERIPELIATPAAIRFVSAEPLLGPVSFRWAKWQPFNRNGVTDEHDGLRRIDWIIVGGESGPGARPMHPAWPRAIRDQCAAAGVAFFFKQWGEWLPIDHCPQIIKRSKGEPGVISMDGTFRRPQAIAKPPDHVFTVNVGKKAAGRLLDGVEHNGMPAI